MANNEIVLDLLEEGETERARDAVAWLISAAKAYGVKAVNPGGIVDWKWGKNARTLSEPVEGYRRMTPAKIIAGLAAIVDDLRLPHPMHIHCNNLGIPGNAEVTLETMRLLEGRRAHLAHLQFHAYGGDGWGAMRSRSRPTVPGSTCCTSSPAASGATWTSRTKPAAASSRTLTRVTTS